MVRSVQRNSNKMGECNSLPHCAIEVLTLVDEKICHILSNQYCVFGVIYGLMVRPFKGVLFRMPLNTVERIIICYKKEKICDTS